MCNSSESKNGNDSKLHIQVDLDLGNKAFVLVFFKRKKFWRAAEKSKSMQHNNKDWRKTKTKILKTIN